MNRLINRLTKVPIFKSDFDYLEQEIGDSWSSRFLLLDDLDLYDHPVYDGWVRSLCWRLPAMTERVAFLMKDLVILAASFYLLKQDLVRASALAKHLQEQERWAA